MSTDAIATHAGVEEVTAINLPEVMQLGQSFFDEGKLPGAFDPEIAGATWAALIQSGAGVILALRNNTGQMVGALGAIVFPDINDGKLVATEAFWYVLPGERHGGGLRLLHAFEEWAAARGAARLIMVHLLTLMPEKLAALYARRGYRPIETHYVKEL